MAEIQYQFDEHVSHAVAEALRRGGISVVTTVEAGLMGASDAAQLAHAHEAGRVIYTEDRDFLRLSSQGADHSGIVYSPRNSRSIGQIVAALTRIWKELDAESMAGRVQFI